MTNRPKSQREIRLRVIRRRKPDYRKLGRALLLYAEAQAEKEAMLDHERREAERKEQRG